MISTLTNFTLKDLQEFLDMCTDSYAATNPFILLKIQTAGEFREETEHLARTFVEAANFVNGKLNSNVMFNTVYLIENLVFSHRWDHGSRWVQLLALPLYERPLQRKKRLILQRIVANGPQRRP